VIRSRQFAAVMVNAQADAQGQCLMATVEPDKPEISTGHH
jgi:hypothetical protein